MQFTADPAPRLIFRLPTHLLLALLCAFGVLLPDHLFGWLNPDYQVAFSPKTASAVLLSCLLALSAPRLLAIRVLLLFFALLQLSQLFHFVYFGTLISPQEVGLLTSEMDEIAASLLGMLPALIEPLLLVVVCYSVLWWLTSRSRAWRLHIPLAPTLLLLLLGVVLPVKAYNSTGSQAFFPNPRHYSIKNTLYALAWSVGKELPNRFLGNHVEQQFEPYRVSDLGAPPAANVIVVMGESLNPNHMGAYGYPRDTTPHLSALRGDPSLVLDKVYSGGVSTKVAVPTFFNLKRDPHNVQVMYRGEANLFRLARSRGMHTAFLSTQNANLAAYVDSGSVDRFVSREDNLDAIEARKDMVLLDLLDSVDFSRPNFIVLHERGSHSPYERYHPDEFRVFPEDRSDMNAFRLNSYDNSVLFSDHVHNEILNLLRERSSLPTYLVFTADHGELIADRVGWKSAVRDAAELLSAADDVQMRWGHSVLDPKTASVPFILYALNGDPQAVQAARSLPYPTHYELGRYIAWLLGYDVVDPNAEEGVYYANGKDIAGNSGYMQMQFNDSGELSDWQVVLP